MKVFNQLSILAFFAVIILLLSCNKSNPYDIAVAPPEAHFVGKKIQYYYADSVTPPAFNVQIGTTDVSNTDRAVTYSVYSTSGAIGEVDYTIATGNNTGLINIKSGEAIGNIAIQARHYSVAGSSDTLIFTLQQPSLKPAEFLDTLIVVIKGPPTCFEAFPNLNSLLGDYPNTNQTLAGAPLGTYGPYVTTVSSIVQTSPTTADMIVEKIWSAEWAPITFQLDWSDPANPIVTQSLQLNIASASTLPIDPTSPYYSWNVLVGSAVDDTPGTYSACDQTFSLNIGLGVYDPQSGAGGFFPNKYMVNMAR